jgi:hypothetical protein
MTHCKTSSLEVRSRSEPPAAATYETRSSHPRTRLLVRPRLGKARFVS